MRQADEVVGHRKQTARHEESHEKAGSRRGESDGLHHHGARWPQPQIRGIPGEPDRDRQRQSENGERSHRCERAGRVCSQQKRDVIIERQAPPDDQPPGAPGDSPAGHGLRLRHEIVNEEQSARRQQHAQQSRRPCRRPFDQIVEPQDEQRELEQLDEGQREYHDAHRSRGAVPPVDREQAVEGSDPGQIAERFQALGRAMVRPQLGGAPAPERRQGQRDDACRAIGAAMRSRPADGNGGKAADHASKRVKRKGKRPAHHSGPIA